jgi:hypothetical protein
VEDPKLSAQNLDTNESGEARCSCGKLVRTYSTLLGQGFCDDDSECYRIARGVTQRTTVTEYKGHGVYQAKEGS